MPVDEIGDHAELRLEVLDRQMRQLPGVIPVETARFPQDRAGAARDRVGDERAAVVLRAGVRGEGVARARPAGCPT